MKRFILVLLFLFSLCICAGAETLTEGDWQYAVEDGYATLTGYTGAGGDLIIPYSHAVVEFDTAL